MMSQLYSHVPEPRPQRAMVGRADAETQWVMPAMTGES